MRCSGSMESWHVLLMGGVSDGASRGIAGATGNRGIRLHVSAAEGACQQGLRVQGPRLEVVVRVALSQDVGLRREHAQVGTEASAIPLARELVGTFCTRQCERLFPLLAFDGLHRS